MGAGVGVPVIVIEPLMYGWRAQWKPNLPSWLGNTSVLVSPGLIVPVSKELSSAVTVWAVVSLLVIWITSPALTVMSEGLKVKFLISMVFSVILVVTALPVTSFVVLVMPQPAKKSEITGTRISFLFIKQPFCSHYATTYLRYEMIKYH